MNNCTCKFVASGQPMNNTGCKVHTKAHYACDDCTCPDYRPNRMPIELSWGTHWGVCVCGHDAAEHNS